MCCCFRASCRRESSTPPLAAQPAMPKRSIWESHGFLDQKAYFAVMLKTVIALLPCSCYVSYSHYFMHCRVILSAETGFYAGGRYYGLYQSSSIGSMSTRQAESPRKPGGRLCRAERSGNQDPLPGSPAAPKRLLRLLRNLLESTRIWR